MYSSDKRTRLTTSQALFTLFFLFFFFTLLNGYLQNLVAGYRADAALVLGGVGVEMAAALLLARRFLALQLDPLEAAGFVVVTLGGWCYFVSAALPTLLPPTQSSDAVRVYQQVMFSYPEGKLVSWYPAGGAFVTAMLARRLDWQPLRILHPVAASFAALSVGAVYGITCALLPPRPLSKITALLAPALLFVPWSYFAGTINWEQYFFAQVFAQYFALAALWFTLSYARESNREASCKDGIFSGLLGAALLGVVAAYPIFVALPLALFGLVVGARTLRVSARARRARQGLDDAPEALTRPPTRSLQDASQFHLWRAWLTLGIFIALLLLAALALQQGGILAWVTGEIAVRGDVGAGGVTTPSLDSLGGPLFLALALVGGWLAWRQGAAGRTILALLLVWGCQLVALLVLQPFFQISGYRVDKTFYILVFPLAILAALPLARGVERVATRAAWSARAEWVGFIAATLVLGAGILAFRPPKAFSPLTESELQVALWAKGFFNNTYQIAYLEQDTISAYWLSIGIWGERIPGEWFQWIPAGRKMGPATFDDWYLDPAWQEMLLVRYLDEVPVKMHVVYQAGQSALLEKEPPEVSGPMPEHRAPPHLVEMNFDNTLTLLGYDIARTVFAPGETISLTTHIQTLYPPSATVGWRVELIRENRANDAVASRVEAAPFGGKYPLQRWPPGKSVSETWHLQLDPNLAPGQYHLRMGLFRRADGEMIDASPIYSVSAADQMPYAPIAKIKIPVTRPSPDELSAAQPAQILVGDTFMLAHYALQADRATNRVHLTLYWQSIARSESDYTVFVHLLDSSGDIIAQRDLPPRGGTYPTALWDPGEIVKDAYTLEIPAAARPPFSLAIGMYSPLTQKRLPVGSRDHLIINFGF